MAKIIILSVYVLFNILTLPSLGTAISSCNGPCNDLNDCAGQLICINGKCNDDPDVGTHICSTPPPPRIPPRSSPPPPRRPQPPPPSSTCSSSGSLQCDGVSYPIFTCSPPVTSSTSAKLTNNDFSEGGDGGAPSECDEIFHKNTERVVALSTGWYNHGSRCGQMIRITSKRNGRSTTAKVVDECDSRQGCDEEHAFQPPCKNNIVDGSNAVWNALGLNIDIGVEDITWSMVNGSSSSPLISNS